jgi:hypothetical protein
LFAWIGLIQITCSLDADGLNCWWSHVISCYNSDTWEDCPR